jgi:predicted dithiol-disulfide oxidoreductase (DUF899 family)
VDHEIVTRDVWLKRRTEFLEKEKEMTRLRDRLAAERRSLPWVKLEKEYVFDGPSGKVSLRELFGKKSQLFIKHFMLGPGQAQHCVGCSLEVDHLEGILVHLEHNDFAYAAVARAPIEEIEALRKRMGWRFTFVSSFRNDFNYDFNVSFRPEEMAAKRAFYNYRFTDPGLEDLSGDSIFTKDETGSVYHTYSTFGRGGEQFLAVYGYLDVLPKGRGENGPYHSLTDWVRPHDMYEAGGSVEGNGRYHPEACGCSKHGREAGRPRAG